MDSLYLTEDFIRQRLAEVEHQPYQETPFEQFKGPMRRAGVLIPLAKAGGEWHILFTRRTDRVEHHKGQVSFPGGGADPEDATLIATALREADEEVGIKPADVRVLGTLGEYLTVSNYLVTPVVGVIPWPYCFKIHTVEVSRVFTMPVSWLADPSNRQEFVRAETGRGVITYFPFDGELLWGATARMTVTFLTVLGL